MRAISRLRSIEKIRNRAEERRRKEADERRLAEARQRRVDRLYAQDRFGDILRCSVAGGVFDFKPGWRRLAPVSFSVVRGERGHIAFVHSMAGSERKSGLNTATTDAYSKSATMSTITNVVISAGHAEILREAYTSIPPISKVS